MSVQCSGTTQKNKPCKRWLRTGLYCHDHIGQAPLTVAIHARGQLAGRPALAPARPNPANAIVWMSHYGTPAYETKYGLKSRSGTRIGVLNTSNLNYTLFAANVRGSAEDKAPRKGNWIDYVIWLSMDAMQGRINLDYAGKHCFLDDASRHGPKPRFVGGHMYVRDAMVDEFPDERFNYILCICSGHNNRHRPHALRAWRGTPREAYVDKNGDPFYDFTPVESGAILLVVSEAPLVEACQLKTLKGKI